MSCNRYAAPAKLPIWQMSRNKTPAPPEGGRLVHKVSTVGSSRVVPEGTKRLSPPRGKGPLVKCVSTVNPKPRRRCSPRTTQNHWSLHSISEATFQVVVFHLCLRFHLYYTSDVAAQSQTGVKLNRVFFPRLALQVRSLDCRFAR